jgi:hypothetical protein
LIVGLSRSEESTHFFQLMETAMRLRSLSPFLAILVVVISALVLATSPARALSNFCLAAAGDCDINHPVYVNVYWDTSQAQWDADVGASNNPGATVARIDALTAAICQSDYFIGLNQYGVLACTVLPSVFVTGSGCGAPPPDIDTANALIGVILYAENPLACVLAAHPNLAGSNIIMAVFLPPQTVPSSPTAHFCSKADGFHQQSLFATYIVIPTACDGPNSGFNGIQHVSKVLTHEMVEAATDPSPNAISGWKVPFGDEVADLCENGPTASTSFLYGSASGYHSNQASGCVFSLDGPAPTISKVDVCGSGAKTRITVTGVFDPRPWDLPAAGAPKTLYLQGAVSGPSNNFGAGGFVQNFPPDSVNFSHITWTGNALGKVNTIVANGFTGNANTRVSPGDKITMTVSSWMTGRPVSAIGTVPGPAKAQNMAVELVGNSQGEIYVGWQTNVFGQIVDSGGCPVGGVGVALTASPDPNAISLVNPSTYDNGNFLGSYTPAGPAGTHLVSVTSPVSASLPVAVHPIAADLQPALGPVAGGKTVTLSGLGFDPVPGHTKVEFATAPATQVSVTASGQIATLQTPPSPLPNHGPGLVDVVTQVNGQASLLLAYQYFIPNQPIFSFAASCLAPTKVIESVTVNAYDTNSNPAAEQITLSATYPAFSKVGSSQSLDKLIISPGDSVILTGAGPFTATPSADPNLAISEKYPTNPPTSGLCSDPTANYHMAVISYFPDPGPVESTLSQPIADKSGQAVAWANAAAPGEVTASIVVTDIGAAAVGDAQKVQVRALGSRDLTAFNRARPFGFARDRKGPIRLLGPNFSVGTATTGVSTAWRTPAVISFLLPAGADASRYAILNSAPDGSSWTEITAAPAAENDRTFLRANVGDAGTYALARVERLTR